jgi:excisionase family DNA binding protein
MKCISNEILNRKQAAEYLGIKEQTLACWACNKRYDLPVYKIGRHAKYRLRDLEMFIEQRRCGLVGVNNDR